MTKDQIFDIFGIDDLKDLPAKVESVIFGDKNTRDNIYRQLIRANGCDMSYEWFQPVYESELSERKQKKQDFTPNSLSVLCSKLTSQKGSIHEPTAGNGSMLIADWWERCLKYLPWEHRPSENMVAAWELSNRSIPILLLNLSIRGMMGYVYHGDVLEGTIKQAYALVNQRDDTLAFSDIYKVDAHARIVDSPKQAAI